MAINGAITYSSRTKFYRPVMERQGCKVHVPTIFDKVLSWPNHLTGAAYMSMKWLSSCNRVGYSRNCLDIQQWVHMVHARACHARANSCDGKFVGHCLTLVSLTGQHRRSNWKRLGGCGGPLIYLRPCQLWMLWFAGRLQWHGSNLLLSCTSCLWEFWNVRLYLDKVSSHVPDFLVGV